MELLAKISDFLTSGGRKAQGDNFFDSPGTPFIDNTITRFDLRRPNAPLRYNQDSELRAYSTHELIYACINKLADVKNDAEIVVEVKDADGNWVPKEGHPLTSLFKRPNEVETGRDFRRLMVQSEQAMGIFYAEITRSAAGLPVELHPLNPMRLQAWPDYSTGSIAFYRYTRVDGRYYDIPPENMMIRRRSDITNRFFGLSPLSVALKSINSDLGLTDYVDAFFESDGTPSGILKILNATVTDTKKEALQAQWKRKYGRGGTNQKGLAVLDQNADYQKIGSNLNELSADIISDRFESRICSVFGVPPILVGAWVGLRHTTANATAKAALRDFWDNKVSPELSQDREWLTWYVLPLFEDLADIRAEKVRANWDISHVAFLQEDADGIHTRARENFKAGLWTLNEAREATGMDPDEMNGSDYYVQPLNVVAISPAIRAAEADKEPQPPPPPVPPADGQQPADAQPPKQWQVDDLPEGTEIESVELKSGPTCTWSVLSFDGKFAVLGVNPCDTPECRICHTKQDPHDHLEKKTFELDGLMLGREPRGVEMIIDLKKIVVDNATAREQCVALLKRFRIELIDQAVQKLDKLDVATAHTLTLVPDPKRRKELQKALKAAYQAGQQQIRAEIATQQAAKSFTSIDLKADGPTDWLDYLDELTDGMVSRIINEITGRAVNQYLSLKLLLDYTIEKLKAALDGQSDKYLDQIAGNGVNAAMNEGRDDEISAQGDNVEYVEYSAILDANTCGPCEDADGETAQDPEDLPQAPNPDCEGGANCRCIHIAVAA